MLVIPVSLIVMHRDHEIEKFGKMTTHKLTIGYPGYPYRWTHVRFVPKCFQGRNREGYFQELSVPITRGLTIMCFCSPAMRLVEKMIAMKSLGEPVLATWKSQREPYRLQQLLMIDYKREEVEENGVIPVEDFKKRSLVTSIIHCLAAWRISREDIPKGILPDHLWARLWEVKVINPHFGDLGPICTNKYHGRDNDNFRSSYLPRVLLAWAPPPEAEDPEADRSSPHP
jgi:hypothetical protein